MNISVVASISVILFIFFLALNLLADVMLKPLLICGVLMVVSITSFFLLPFVTKEQKVVKKTVTYTLIKEPEVVKCKYGTSVAITTEDKIETFPTGWVKKNVKDPTSATYTEYELKNEWFIFYVSSTEREVIFQ